MARPDASVAHRHFRAQMLTLLVLAVAGLVVLWFQARQDVRDDAVATSMTVAQGIADNPYVARAVTTSDPTAALQPYARRLMADTGVDFVTIMDTDRTRLTHPDPDRIGERFLGSVEPALDGRAFTETYAGTLGPSVRAVVPVVDGDEVVALVAAGVTVDNVTQAVWRRLPWLAFAVGAFLVAAVVSATALSRSLQRVTGGRGPEELARIFASYESVLHSVREGLLVVDDGRVVLHNDQAGELLGLDQAPTPVPVASLDLPMGLRDVLTSGARVVDGVYLTHERVLVVNQEPTGTRSAVVTIRDRTEIEALASEVQSMRTLSDALRAQTHEHANRLHAIVSMIETGRTDAARDFATRDLTSQALVDRMVDAVHEPVVSALLLGKAAQAAERGVELHLDVDPALDRLVGDPRDVVTVLGNLVDNALDAAVGDPPWIEVYLGADDVAPEGRPVTSRLVVQVSDSGPGIAEPDRAFERGYSTKEPGMHGRGYGLALVQQAVARRGGTLDIEREPRSVVTATLPSTVALRSVTTHDATGAAARARRTPDVGPAVGTT